jgi:NitT/TauT family transport system ATP-binding protein
MQLATARESVQFATRDCSPMAQSLAPASADSTPMVLVDAVSHHFGDLLILQNITLSISRGEFIALVGMSGCGKTTLLNLIAGLLSVEKGRISVAGQVVQGPRKMTGYMFARDALLPWRTAIENVAYGLELRGVPAAKRRACAKDWLERLGLAAAANKYRSQLSQGMRQRVALGRTLAFEPDLLLLDEPFAALDAQTKQELQPKFLELWEGSSTTVVLVTHDIDEAISMADRVIVMSRQPGRIAMEVPVPIARPRNVGDLIDDPTYRAIRHQVRDALLA